MQVNGMRFLPEYIRLHGMNENSETKADTVYDTFMT